MIGIKKEPLTGFVFILAGNRARLFGSDVTHQQRAPLKCASVSGRPTPVAKHHAPGSVVKFASVHPTPTGYRLISPSEEILQATRILSFFFFNIFFLKISNLKFGIGWNSTSDETDGWFEQHYIWSYILLQVVCSYWIVFIELVYLQRKQLWLNGLFTENHRASLELFDFWANLGGCWLISRSSSSSLSWQNLWQLCPNSCPPVSADTPILNWKTKTHEANSWRLRWWNQFTFVRGFG